MMTYEPDRYAECEACHSEAFLLNGKTADSWQRCRYCGIVQWVAAQHDTQDPETFSQTGGQA